MPRLGEEVAVRGTRHVETRAHVRDHLGIVPIGTLADIGLLAPDLGERRGKVAVPIVEAEIDAAEELQESTARRVAQHRHRRNRAEPDHTVGAVLLGGVDVGDGHDLLDLVPTRSPEPAFAAGRLIFLSRTFIRLQGLPRLHGVAELALLGSIGVDQRAPDERVLDPQRAIQIPGIGDTPLTAARFVGRQRVLQQRVVQLLRLPSYDPVFDVDLPGTAACTVDAVRAAHDAIVLEAVAVELLPLPGLGRNDVFNPTHRCFPIASCSQFRWI